MGTNSALLARRVIDNTYQVLAIQMLSLVQAIDYLRIEDNLSSRTRQAYRQIRDIVPVFVEDTVKYPEIRLIKDFLSSRLLSFFD
jgi:histidine ammonia-lyase